MHYAIHRSNKVCHPVILHTNQEISWKPFSKWPLDALCQKRWHPHTLGIILSHWEHLSRGFKGVSSYKFPKVATITLPNEATVCRCASRNPCDPWSFVKLPWGQPRNWEAAHKRLGGGVSIRAHLANFLRQCVWSPTLKSSPPACHHPHHGHHPESSPPVVVVIIIITCRRRHHHHHHHHHRSITHYSISHRHPSWNPNRPHSWSAPTHLVLGSGRLCQGADGLAKRCNIWYQCMGCLNEAEAQIDLKGASKTQAALGFPPWNHKCLASAWSLALRTGDNKEAVQSFSQCSWQLRQASPNPRCGCLTTALEVCHYDFFSEIGFQRWLWERERWWFKAHSHSIWMIIPLSKRWETFSY